MAKRIVSGLRGGPLPHQSDLVRCSKVADACNEQAVQRAGLVGANKKRVPVDDPVDSMICVVVSRSGPDLVGAGAGSVGRAQRPTDGASDDGLFAAPSIALRVMF